MSKPRRDKPSFPVEDTLFAIKQRKAVPHEFVLDAIASLSPETRSMFGCLAVYVQDKIVLILRDKRDGTADNGVWLATTEEHHQSLRREFPNMRSIQVLGKKVTGWAGPPGRHAGFRRGCDARMRACPRGRSSNREGTWSAAHLEVRGQAGGTIPEAGRRHPRRPGTRVRSRDKQRPDIEA